MHWYYFLFTHKLPKTDDKITSHSFLNVFKAKSRILKIIITSPKKKRLNKINEIIYLACIYLKN